MRTPFEFSALAAGELTLDGREGTVDTWELRHGDKLVGVIEMPPRRARVSGRSGTWSVASQRHRLGHRLTCTPINVDRAAAYYHPRHLLPGGRLALSDQRRFDLRPPGIFGKAWKLSHGDGREFTRIPIISKGHPARTWLLRLDHGAAGEPEALLIVLTTCYAIVADQAQRPLSTADAPRQTTCDDPFVHALSAGVHRAGFELMLVAAVAVIAL